ncbi:MAG TPA: Maf family protein [Candidatus Acidoferrales bacterium]|nr:Maf family protein [Candidatus Acidoferrales bacterium]
MPRLHHPRLVLASASPRRAEILRSAGIPFRILPASVDESPRKGESPARYAARLARAKALAATRHVRGPAIILGADTVVVLGRKILGKPSSLAHARRMLRLLSGRTHRVLTAVALLRLAPGGRRMRLLSAVESTRVSFARLSPREIAAYVATGEPIGKAGAYAIQGRAGKFITRIEGCYFNVVGLPLARLSRLLRSL